MDNHAVPRQITTFEFKLLGFFTVKQGIYLAITTGLTVIVYFLIPVPILNILIAGICGAFGTLMTLYRYNDRSMDIWVKNLAISLLRPSQYIFHKDNEAPDFLKGVVLSSDLQTQTHLDASQKLNAYMTQTGQAQPDSQAKQNMNVLIHSTPAQQGGTAQQAAAPVPAGAPSSPPVDPLTSSPVDQLTSSPPHQPFISGLVKNSKDAPLGNIMVYVNSDAGQLVRILKTNHNGVFATFHPLPTGNYILSPKDLGGTFFFDTINVAVNGAVKEPIQLFSKELL